MITKGQNCIVSENVKFGENVTLGHNVIIEDNVIIGSHVYIDSNTTIRQGVTLGDNSFVGANCIIGEYWMDFCIDRVLHVHPLTIGKDALIRSGSIIYAGSDIGEGFQTGHQVTIREKARIGNHVSVGTLSDIQGNCDIGNYVRLHSNVHIGQLSVIDDFVWIFPYVVLTNDPTPPSNNFVGVHIHPFAIVATGAIIMPGIEIGQDALVAASAMVNKPIAPYAVVGGNPAKQFSDVRNIKNKITGEPVYPWRLHFDHYMPWSESDFNTWYASLELEEKENYKIKNIISEE
jgi:acetyltransferase-like isoleucine patch superfamily enzyme